MPLKQQKIHKYIRLIKEYKILTKKNPLQELDQLKWIQTGSTSFQKKNSRPNRFTQSKALR